MGFRQNGWRVMRDPFLFDASLIVWKQRGFVLHASYTYAKGQTIAHSLVVLTEALEKERRILEYRIGRDFFQMLAGLSAHGRLELIAAVRQEDGQ